MPLQNGVSLGSLPRELFDAVMSNIEDRADFSSLSRTCKAIRSLTIQLVFENVTMLWANNVRQRYDVRDSQMIANLRKQNSRVTETEPGCECPRLDLLLRSILENPKLGNYVQKINLQCFGWDRARFGRKPSLPPPPDTDEYQALVLAAMRRTGISKSRLKEHFELGLKTNEIDIAIDFLIVLCPNIESLTLSVDIVARNPVLRLLLEDYAWSPDTSECILRLQHLKDIQFGTGTHRGECGNTLDTLVRTEPGRDLLLQLHSCFNILSLPELKEAQLSLPLLIGVWEREAYRLPVEAKPSSTMQVLRLHQCAIEPSFLQSLLNLTPFITHLEYEFELYSYIKMQAQDLAPALSCIKRSLKHLKITLDMWSTGDQFMGQYLEFNEEYEYIEGHCSLRELVALETVTIPSCILLGWTNSKSPDLVDVLPENLVSICLTDDFGWCDSYEKEEEEMLPILRKFVAGNSWTRTSPRLESVNIKAHEWKAVDETVALFKDSGLACEVTVFSGRD